jgi:hypothetical protein
MSERCVWLSLAGNMGRTDAHIVPEIPVKKMCNFDPGATTIFKFITVSSSS